MAVQGSPGVVTALAVDRVGVGLQKKMLSWGR